MVLRTFRYLSLFAGSLLAWSTANSGNPEFIENRGQWPEQVNFKVELSFGALFLENGGFTYSLLGLETYRNAHENHTPFPNHVPAHSFKMTFSNSSQEMVARGKEKSTHYRNYFIGNDSSQWGSKAYSYQEVEYVAIYEGVDMKMYQNGDHLKYDLVVAPHADAHQIEMSYQGLDGIRILENGDLELQNTLSNVIERSPIAFQFIEGEKVAVPCHFKLMGNSVKFNFPDGYNTSVELIIDPELVFSSYSGSTADNFGSSATYDNTGHLYGGGTNFGAGYPTTLGAYSQPAAGNTDISISKFSPDGSSLIYSTFIGGSASEAVHSLIVNNNNELCILGTSASQNYPTSVNCFQAVQNAGPAVNWDLSYGYGVVYSGGCCRSQLIR